MIPSTLHPAQLQLPLHGTGRRARSAQTAQKKKDANMLHSSFPQIYSMLNIHRPFTEQQQYASPQLPEYCSTSSQRLNCPLYISPPPLKQEKPARRHENQKTDPLQSPLHHRCGLLCGLLSVVCCLLSAVCCCVCGVFEFVGGPLVRTPRV